MLSVQHILALPLFEQAALVAGADGLDRSIRHVHVVDVPEPNFRWAKGGELMLTAGYSLPNDPTAAAGYIERLHHLNLAGLVISVGPYLQHTPDAIREAANIYHFPVIELPADVAFADVTRDLMGRLIDQQHTINQRSSHIHKTLMTLVLDGKGLQDVANELARMINRSITIESPSFVVLATAQVGKVDLARQRSVDRGQTSQHLAAELLERGIYDRLLNERDPVYVAPINEIGMSMERIVAPIIVANQITGYVWIIAGERRLDPLDNLAIETASLVTALIMLRERDQRRQARKLRGDLLSRLLRHPDPADPELVELAHRAGFQLNLTYQILAIRAQDQNGDPANTDALQQQVERNVHQRRLVTRRDRMLIVLLQAHHTPDGPGVAQALYNLLDHPTLRVWIGVGMTAETMQDIWASFESAAEAIEISDRRGQSPGVAHFSELGAWVWLRHIDPGRLHHNRYYRLVTSLADNHNVLYQSLFAYLQQDKNISATAFELHIHRNTLTQRLRRAEQLLEVSLDDAETCMNLYVAFQAHHLHRG